MSSIEVHDVYPHPIKKRYGGILPAHPGIRKILTKRAPPQYLGFLTQTAKYNALFQTFSYDNVNDDKPCWMNGFLPFLDIVALFGFIAARRPKRYLEIGSGYSTKVASFARAQLSLNLKISSIDPHPRAEIDPLCDELIRSPLQDCDLSIVAKLEPGDILFFDGSHRVLQNSDNQVLFFEIIPMLKPGVLIHVHDVNWPHDYPDAWADRYYNEQYVLGAMLLYAPDSFEVLFPAAHVSMYLSYQDNFRAIWERPGYESMQKHGCSFWFQKAAPPPT